MTRMNTIIAAAATLLALQAGCRKPVHFPVTSLTEQASAAAAYRAYDTDEDGKADFFMFANDAGRVSGIGYAGEEGARCEEKIDLDAIDADQCRHLVLILDGVGYDLVKQYYDVGRLRVFHRPSRVVAPYPTLTDLSLVDALGLEPCRGFEAKYFDRQANRIAGGSADYLAGKNEPYNELLQYRADMIWDAIGYIAPRSVFGKEVNDAKRLFDRDETREVLAYFVSSAGVSTAEGAAGQLACLERIEQFVNQVLQETRGRTKVTLLADHGHTYTPAKRIPLEAHLKDNGWRLTDRPTREKDVAYIRFGLETYAAFATSEPAALAGDLVGCEGVALASFARGQEVVVLTPGGARAVIREKDGRYAYAPAGGDPLKLKGVLAKLQADKAGYYGADELLAATVTHVYPTPLQRLWRAHFSLAGNRPDVIVSLDDWFYSGSKGLGRMVDIASTHGGLNYANSVTFIMSTAGALPAAMRSADIPRHMSKLFGVPWPTRK